MSALWRRAWNELLAIGPLWLACAFGVAAAPLWAAFQLAPIAVVAYVFGSVAVGAHVVGHEYAHRTLPALLAQPVRRATTLAIKLAVLAVALVTLAAVAAAGPYSPIQRFPGHTTLDSRVIYLPTLMGLTLAPYLALVARSTLGGAVFSIAVPGMLLLIGDMLGLVIYGFALPSEIDRFKYAVFANASVAVCLVAAVAVWRRFARLEVLDGRAGHVAIPMVGRWTARDRARSTHAPLWLLFTKELRLQQMALIVVALYVLTALSLRWLVRSRELEPEIPWQALTVLYGCLASMLIGALASAEERQLGTLDWQGLMPVSRRTQFAVKIAVVIGLAVACAALLPAGVAMLSAPSYGAAIPGFVLWMCLAAIACAVGGLYVSTLSSSGVKAVVFALPFVASAFLLLRASRLIVWQAVWHGWIGRHWLVTRRLTDAEAQSVSAGALAAIAIVVLILAHRNHWTARRPIGAIAAQMTAVAATIAAAGVGLFMFGFR